MDTVNESIVVYQWFKEYVHVTWDLYILPSVLCNLRVVLVIARGEVHQVGLGIVLARPVKVYTFLITNTLRDVLNSTWILNYYECVWVHQLDVVGQELDGY